MTATEQLTQASETLRDPVAAYLAGIRDRETALLVAEWLEAVAADAFAVIGAGTDAPHPVVAAALALAEHINERTSR